MRTVIARMWVISWSLRCAIVSPDAINEGVRLFISLTDVVIDDKERSGFVAINKNLIESVIQL